MNGLAIGERIAGAVDWLLANAQGPFDGVTWLIGGITDGLEGSLLAFPAWLLALALIGMSAWRVGFRFAVFTCVALAIVVGMGLWEATVSTLALVLAATLVSLFLGVPLGIWAASRDAVDRLVRPLLDFMQTMPAFVYLIPAAMLFGLGKVPGTIATIIFCMPPSVRLTNLGIRQVPREMIEVGVAFGCTPRQLLTKVQVPIALPTIMAGVNQTIMLALSMVVIASMIGAGGLGDVVLRGIQRLDVGLGFEGGLGVVLLAVVLDRITESFGTRGPRTSVRQRLRALLRGEELAAPVEAGEVSA